jgi:yecA family protein
MESAKNIDYEQVEEVLAEAEFEASASELQAILCGMLAAGINLNDKNWLTTIVDIANDGRSISEEAETTIQSIFTWTHHQMNQHDSLAPTLLPDDSYPAVDQLESVAVWCQGFLLGFGLQTGNSDVSNPEVKESLTDLADISQLELEAEENEETQTALFTLIEHIKVAVQLIYWEMVLKKTAGAGQASSAGKTIH